MTSEKLEKGTLIKRPSEEVFTLEDTHYLLTRQEVDNVILLDEVVKLCKKDLSQCNTDLINATKEPSTFWNSRSGKIIIVGGFSVVITAAFIGGIVTGVRIAR